MRSGRYDALLVLLLVANVAAHLGGIADPILGHHAWRQADTAAIARNYLEVDGNFFRPRIDYLGNASGVTGTELPIYSYLVYLGYLAGGEHLLIARVLSVVASCVALVAAYVIAAFWMNRRVGLVAAFFLACSPIFFHYGRNVQPDVMMVATALVGMACWLQFERTRLRRWLIAAIVGAGTAAMIKPYALVVFAPLVIVEAPSPRPGNIRPVLVLLGSTIGLTGAWYGYAYHLTRAYGDFRYFGGFLYEVAAHPLGAAWSSLTSTHFLADVLGRGFRKLYLGYVGAAYLAIGAISAGALPARARRYVVAWIVLALVWIALAGDMVAIHEYYALPLVPALAIIAALGFERVWRSDVRLLRLGALCLLAVAPILPMRYSWHLRAGNLDPALVEIGPALDALVPRASRVVIGPDRSPVVALYHAHRRGWTFPTVVTAATFRDFITQGATVLVSNDRTFEQDPDVAPYLRWVGSVGTVRVFSLVDLGEPGGRRRAAQTG